MGSRFSTLSRIYKVNNPPYVPPLPSSQPIRFGILGAAAIAPDALIKPVKSHPEAVVFAVAARDKGRAEAYAKKYGIAKAYGGAEGYQALLDDPEVDAVYNPLPNGLHFEWTMKALAAGKHVLLEKPSANTAEETRIMYEYAEAQGLVLLEAFHYRFHPAAQRVKAILDSGELGAIKSLDASLALPKLFFRESDIRYNFNLGGGALMDMGCYTINFIRYLSGANPTSIITASVVPFVPENPTLREACKNIDRRTTATFAIPSSSGSSDITASMLCDLAIPNKLGFIPQMPKVGIKVVCEGGEIDFFNFAAPALYHSITVTKKGGNGKGSKRVEKAYTFGNGGKGEEWWMTYRHQLEAFIDRLKGRTPQMWLAKEDAVSNMEWIENVYRETGLGSRPKSNFKLDA